MKAVVYTKYGSPDVLEVKEVDKPAPKDGEVLIKVHAVSLNASDWEGLRGKPFYARVMSPFKPHHHILGSDIAGRVEAVGANVTKFQPGDDVFGDNLSRMGGFAEYTCASENGVARKPADMTFEEAAAIPQAGVIALQGLRDRFQPGQHVLINGAGGSTGSFAIQLAKMYGAEVTGVDNGGKQEFMRSLGADHVIDYTREDFTRNGKQYDLILDVIAYRSVFAYKRALAPNGSYYLVGGAAGTIFQALLLGSWIGGSGRKLRLLVVKPSLRDLLHVAELVRSGKVKVMIDRRFPLDEVPEALGYLGAGKSKGKVIISVH